jgi:hypothetical protein
MPTPTPDDPKALLARDLTVAALDWARSGLQARRDSAIFQPGSAVA